MLLQVPTTEIDRMIKFSGEQSNPYYYYHLSAITLRWFFLFLISFFSPMFEKFEGWERFYHHFGCINEIILRWWVVPPSRQWVYNFIHTHQYIHNDTLRIIWEKNNTCEISHRVEVHRTNSQDKREGVFTVISTLAKELLKIRERPVRVHYHIRIIRISHFEKKTWPLREGEKRWKVRVSPTFIYAQSNKYDHTHTYTNAS